MSHRTTTPIETERRNDAVSDPDMMTKRSRVHGRQRVVDTGPKTYVAHRPARSAVGRFWAGQVHSPRSMDLLGPLTAV
jgi:hypothetical protein